MAKIGRPKLPKSEKKQNFNVTVEKEARQKLEKLKEGNLSPFVSFVMKHVPDDFVKLMNKDPERFLSGKLVIQSELI